MQSESERSKGGSPPSEPGFPPLPRIEWYARGLLAFGGVISFVGFVVVAYGLSQPIPVNGLAQSFLFGFAFLSPAVAGGIVLIGLGVMFGFVGAAMKGLPREWREAVPSPPLPSARELPIHRCPNCGVHTYLNVCPECGHRLAASPTP